jgi:hypothetical protein
MFEPLAFARGYEKNQSATRFPVAADL